MQEKEFLRTEERDYRAEILEIIRNNLTSEKLSDDLKKYHYNDIACAFDELTESERNEFLTNIGYLSMSDIIPFLDDAGEYLSTIDATTAADIIEQMDADEALEVLEALDEETKNELLELIEDQEIKEEIELLESYDDDEFGSRMSVNFIAIERGLSIKKAMRSLISEAAENDNIYTLFVVNNDGTFYGAIDLKDLIVARSEDVLDDLICTTFPYVYDKDKISENIDRMRAYSEDLIPVLSSKHGRLLGVITSTDVIDIIDDEFGDDYAKLAALAEEEEHDEPLLKSIKKRIPWLIILLFMGLAVSAVVGLFEGIVDELPMIVAFQSLILGMAGNVGTQSLAVTVRAIGSDDSFTLKSNLKLIFKETRIALLNGIAVGLISFIMVCGYLFLIAGYGIAFSSAIAGCVGAAMCFAMMISGFTGAFIPTCLYRLGIDPAVASGPLITTVNDLVAVVTYYGLAWVLLINFCL